MKLIAKYNYILKYRFSLRKYLSCMRNKKKFVNKLDYVKSEIVDIKYNFKEYFTQNIFTNLPITFEIFFNQYNLFRNIRSEYFNFNVLQNGKVSYPLTFQQIKVLEKNNLKVNKIFSKILLISNGFFEFVKGLFIFLIIIYQTILNIIFKKKFNENYIYVKNLSKLQILSMDKIKKNFFDWATNILKLTDYKLIHNNSSCKKNYIYNKFFIPELNSFKELIIFIFLFFKFNFYLFLDVFFLRFSQFLIYSELIKFSCSLSKNKEILSKSYFLFNTNAFFRPLYTYSLGSNVYFFEYSTNNKRVYYENDLIYDQFNLKNLTWNKYILWNEQHKKFFQKNQIINAEYLLCDHISFGTSKNFELNIDSKNSLIVFDSAPFRKSIASFRNFSVKTYDVDKIIKFHEEILKLKNNKNFYIKIKRENIDNKHSKKYNYFLKNSRYQKLDPAFDPEEVISKFDKIICHPFSSTAFIAKKLNKDVCFFDVCQIHKDFDDYHKGIKIIRNLDELQNWYDS